MVEEEQYIYSLKERIFLVTHDNKLDVDFNTICELFTVCFLNSPVQTDHNICKLHTKFQITGSVGDALHSG